jgi:hypothetical protein
MALIWVVAFDFGHTPIVATRETMGREARSSRVRGVREARRFKPAGSGGSDCGSRDV